MAFSNFFLSSLASCEDLVRLGLHFFLSFLEFVALLEIHGVVCFQQNRAFSKKGKLGAYIPLFSKEDEIAWIDIISLQEHFNNR